MSDRLPVPAHTISPERTYWIAVLLAAALAVAVRTPAFADLWNSGHNGWGGAFYGNVARNFLRYGFAATDFAPVVNSGIVDPRQFHIYYHHPPLTMWLTSLSFLVFGVHEWSARLVPLAFSFLTLAVVFEFARAAYGKAAALCALLVLAVLPIDAYYAAHVDPNSSVSIFFTTLAVEGYRRWLASGGARHYALIVAAIALGCTAGWYTYLVVPPMFAHFWLIYRSPRKPAMWKHALFLPVVPVIVFALFLLHRHIALTDGRFEIYDRLGDRVLKRTTGHGLGIGAFVKIYGKHLLAAYTVPFLALGAGWLALFLAELRAKRLQDADWCILVLLSYGFLYALAFPGHLPSHDFFVRTYAPGLALASAVVVTHGLEALQGPAERMRVPGAAFAATIVLGALFAIYRLYADDDRANGARLKGYGEVVGALTTPRDPVIMPIPDERLLQYYVDRPITFGIDTPQKLEAAAAVVRGRYLVIVPERNAVEFPELVSHLRARHPEARERGLLIFQGSGKI